jgi:hypothetical protein
LGNDFTHNLGKVGHDLTIEQGIEASRVCVLNLMQTTRQAIKTLDNVESIIEVFGMVNCIDSFKEHSKVLNGASEILNFIFGQNGIHTRVAMGTNSLPFTFSVEIKMIIQIKTTMESNHILIVVEESDSSMDFTTPIKVRSV